MTDTTDERSSVEIVGNHNAEYQRLANEAGRRVWTVIQNLIEVETRKTKGVLQGEPVQAILIGSMSGIASHVARMDLTAPPGSPKSAVELILDDLGNQFLHTIEQMRKQDPVAMMMGAGQTEGEGKN